MKTIVATPANLKFVGVYPRDLGTTLTTELLQADWYEIPTPEYKNLILIDADKVSPALAAKLSPLKEIHWENGLTNGVAIVDPRLKIANNDEGFVHY